MIEVTRYDHLEGWAQEFMIPAKVLAQRLHEVAPVPGRGPDGKVVGFYSEEDVRRLCAELLMPKPLGALRR